MPENIISRGNNASINACIPLPLQVVIDDVGWWSGEDGSPRQEPYRTGISRNHVPADYRSIADLGKALGIRPQAAMIMCEWDKENILKDLPTATWMGEKWDNSKWVGPWMEEAAEIIRTNRDNLEFTMHGIGHEYWENGTFTRAEWHDMKGNMRPRDQVEKHLVYYEKLLNQHNLGPFPRSFVPTAFCHRFGPSEGNESSLAAIFATRGIKYINTPFSILYNREATLDELFGIDSGVITIDRGEDEFNWDIMEGHPSKDHKSPTFGLHWPNLLHADPDRNPEVVEQWVKYLRQYNDKPERILSPDSLAFRKQLVHNRLTSLVQKGSITELDFSKSDSIAPEYTNDEFVIKITSSAPLKFRADGIRIVNESFVKKDGFLYTLQAERMKGSRIGRIESLT